MAMVRHAEEAGEALPEDPRKLATARYAMQLGLRLERLTQPNVVDPDLGARMVSHSIDGGSEDGLPHKSSGLREGPPASRALLERERWPHERLARFRHERLQDLTRHVAAHAPFA